MALTHPITPLRLAFLIVKALAIVRLNTTMSKTNITRKAIAIPVCLNIIQYGREKRLTDSPGRKKEVQLHKLDSKVKPTFRDDIPVDNLVLTWSRFLLFSR
jgi:hypothetical protein